MKNPQVKQNAIGNREPISRSEVESEIAALFIELLGVEPVGPSDNLILLGGESLLAMQAASRIRERFGREVPIRTLFVGTVAEIAADIIGSESSSFQLSE